MISASVKLLLIEGFMLVPAFVFTMTLRGFARAWMSKREGDVFPEECGFLTLDPAAHVNIFAAMFVAVIFTIIDYIAPVSPTSSSTLFVTLMLLGPNWVSRIDLDPYRFDKPSRGVLRVFYFGIGVMLFAALMAFYASRIMVKLSVPEFILEPLSIFFIEFAVCCIWFPLINLIPLPSLDGEVLLSYFFPATREYTEQITPFIGIAIIMLILPVLRVVMMAIMLLLSNLVFI
ncbi:hypothetical protein ACFLY6_00700 [Candidatus Dependentiae bacterium]